MKPNNIVTILRKDVLLGPRGAYFLWIVLFPLLITLMLRLVFGGLIDPSPRLGIYDAGDSAITEAAGRLEGFEVSILDSEQRLREMVEAYDLDAGLILPADFDRRLTGGEYPELPIVVSGESFASDRIVILTAVIDLVRGAAGEPFPVEAEIVFIGGGPSVPLIDRLVPLLVLLAVSLAAIFLPAASIIQEREAKTMVAILSTPLEAMELLTAKGIIGFVLGFAVGAVTLLINSGFTAYTGGHLVVLAVASLMCVFIGLSLGAAVKDMTTLFTVWKSGALVLFAPAVLFLFPSVPEWIARIFPTYYFMGPLYDMVIEGAVLSDVGLDLGIGIVITVVFAGITALVGRRMEMRLASA